MSDNFSNKIKQLRISQGLTLQEVGDKVGVGKSTVRKWENGIIENMRRDKISKLAHALGVTPAFLMGWDESKETALPPAAAPRTLTADESKLLDNYSKLNTTGRDKVQEYAADLTEQRKYTEDTASSMSAAG